MERTVNRAVTTVRFYSRRVYGLEALYLADEEVRAALSPLVQTRTVSQSQLRALSALGCDVVQVPDPQSVRSYSFSS